MAGERYDYTRQGRNRAALWIVPSVWLLLLTATLRLEASVWLMLLIGAFTLPALWELITNPASGLTMDAQSITWFTGNRSAELELSEIERFRLDTRLDLSVKATAILKSGRKIRLPYECTPPHQRFEAELNARGIRTERHHFSPVG